MNRARPEYLSPRPYRTARCRDPEQRPSRSDCRANPAARRPCRYACSGSRKCCCLSARETCRTKRSRRGGTARARRRGSRDRVEGTAAHLHRKSIRSTGYSASRIRDLAMRGHHDRTHAVRPRSRQNARPKRFRKCSISGAYAPCICPKKNTPKLPSVQIVRAGSLVPSASRPWS